MSTKEPTEADILRPINTFTKKYIILYGAAALGLVAFLIAWAYQLQKGLIVTGLGDWGSGGGSTWGLYIGAFIWWVGVAHGGIILSAAVRLLGMDRYMPIARLAEMTTIGGLSAAGFYILVHMGRPDRMVTSVIGHYHITVNNSPLVWDVTVITAYFVLSATYLGLTLRYDISRLRDDLPDMFEPVYKIMTIGYSEKEDEVIDRMVWWLAAAVIIMAPLLLHGGVIPWLFALLPAMPAWSGGIQGPMFLAIALMSAISGVMIISYAFRRAYDWDHIITDDIFRGLLLWLGFFTLLFLWFQLQANINGVFLGPTNSAVAAEAKMAHPLYQMAMALAFLTLVYIFLQAIRPSLFSKKRALIASCAILTATLTEKILFVVEGFLHPTFDIYANTPGTYFPSAIEWLSLVGTAGLVALLFLNLSKLVPVVELHAVEHMRGDHEHGDDATEPEVEA
ncbi:polysulfide reductase NrfD [Natrinema pellirubrum DSM 15624]|uniref:Polysulfide reductase n=1 Tax=Natrinema pellirubrum (strain DSM 15624 / CIP 106293 / JCM 10476 / NCIMB 786 / 157) TaxID=797303 RepID=L0JKZ5_NATP1|nr:NrfD/PsrC family molybdoenzyme membrane anchor subunit [Natrinema pellirubrum]AGB32200.1 polysulfide reductase [Natrinema pellirubrum DSM 15624]ELY74979.1 polysulfide reductase NrfD [Natrinema pellirubrum DSM 15624]